MNQAQILHRHNVCGAGASLTASVPLWGAHLDGDVAGCHPGLHKWGGLLLGFSPRRQAGRALNSTRSCPSGSWHVQFSAAPGIRVFVRSAGLRWDATNIAETKSSLIIG